MIRAILNVFIIIHLLLIVAWLFPINTALLSIRDTFQNYIIFLGLDQNYSMFAPEVRKTNRHLIALVTFKDLSTVVWTYPRQERLGFMDAIQKERYRKFANDNLVNPSCKMYLPNFARYIVKNFVCRYACTDVKPDLVSLYLSETDILTPLRQPNSTVMNKSDSIEEDTNHSRLTNIFTYQLEPNDLSDKYINGTESSKNANETK